MTMLHRDLENTRIKTVEGNMAITSQYTAGIAGEKFLRALKERGELLGSYCGKCKKTFLPVRLFCERCLTRLDETKSAPLDGILESFTKVGIDLNEKKLHQSRWIGFVSFRGFEGGLIHYLQVSDEKKLKIGRRVTPHFQPRESRTGSILDILYFSLV